MQAPETIRPVVGYVKSAPCPTPWVWIVLFIIACLIICALAALLIVTYIVKRRAKTKEIVLVNPGFVVSNNQITASWTNNDLTKGNIYNLYATNNPPVLGATGILLNPNPFQSNEVSGDNSNTAQVSGLVVGTKYYATLVVRNAEAQNYQIFSQLLFMNSSAPSSGATADSATHFVIEHILQGGALQITNDAPVNNMYQVEYSSDSSCERSVFFMNSRGQIQSSDTTLENICLFGEAGKLVARSCVGAENTALAADLLANSQWTYNPQGAANKWCLNGTVGTGTGVTGPVCMVMGSLNASSHTTTVSVNSASQIGDAWANYHRTQPVRITE